ncbi:MAG: YwiC-like family protein [Chloroflexi bacterium]|nr:YwiC-like family protein [Chloroflexota bacterium]
MGSRIQPPLPREHGAWPMFAVPVLVGIGAAGAWSVSVILFALTAFGFFLLRYPLMLAVKSRAREARLDALRWSAIYGSATVVLGAALILVSQQWLLVPIGALGFVSLVVYLWHVAHRAEMTAVGEWLGIAGLALGAPGAYLVGTGTLDGTALALYLLDVLYFGGTVFYIKFKVREQPRLAKSDARWLARLWAGRVTLAYHAMVIALVALFAMLGMLPALAVIAFVPMVCKAIGGVMTQPARLNIRRLGFIELGLTVVFAVVVLAAYR